MIVTLAEETSVWWDLVPAVVGGIIGALCGGVPAYLLAVRASKEATNKENEILESQNRSKATRIFLQFQHLLNDTIGTLILIEEMLIDLKTNAEVDPYRIQRRVRPLANVDYLDYQNFDPADLSLLFENDQGEIAQNLIQYSLQYNAVLNGLRKYRDLKMNYFPTLKELPVSAIGPDGKVTSQIRQKDLPQLRLEEAQLESVIQPTIKSMRLLADDLFRLAPRLGPSLKSCVNPDKKMISFDEAAVEKLRTLVLESRAGLEYITEIPLSV